MGSGHRKMAGDRLEITMIVEDLSQTLADVTMVHTKCLQDFWAATQISEYDK